MKSLAQLVYWIFWLLFWLVALVATCVFLPHIGVPALMVVLIIILLGK